MTEPACDYRRCRRTHAVTHPLRYYEFTPEEKRALEECDRESFFYRCLPLSTLLASVTYVAIKNGFLAQSVHFGAFPKLTMAALLGHFMGRFSYINECDAKLREDLSKDSFLGETLREYHLKANPPFKK